MHRIAQILLALAVSVVVSGCSHMAPQYSPSIENVQRLKDADNNNAKVGEFTSSSDPGNYNPIMLRGSKMLSPYKNSYAAYVAEAIKQELALAKKLSPNSDTEITGTLLKNDVGSTDMSVGFAEIHARFVVKRSGQVRYDQVKTVRHEFPSSFAGAIAIPRAIQEYPFAVQNLLAKLYQDPAFIAALK